MKERHLAFVETKRLLILLKVQNPAEYAKAVHAIRHNGKFRSSPILDFDGQRKQVIVGE